MRRPPSSERRKSRSGVRTACVSRPRGELEQRLRQAARNGLHPREAQNIEQRLARIEQRLVRDARDGRNQWGQNGWSDRDRDGRDDRYEDDRGSRRDR